MFPLPCERGSCSVLARALVSRRVWGAWLMGGGGLGHGTGAHPWLCTGQGAGRAVALGAFGGTVCWCSGCCWVWGRVLRRPGTLVCPSSAAEPGTVCAGTVLPASCSCPGHAASVLPLVMPAAPWGWRAPRAGVLAQHQLLSSPQKSCPGPGLTASPPVPRLQHQVRVHGAQGGCPEGGDAPRQRDRGRRLPQGRGPSPRDG